MIDKTKIKHEERQSPKQKKSEPYCVVNTQIRPNTVCPVCRRGVLDYNGLLQIECPYCGLIETGACT